MTTIIGIKISNRLESAVSVQEILTKYGCIIKTRIGLHEEINGQCSPRGLILLEIINDEERFGCFDRISETAKRNHASTATY